MRTRSDVAAQEARIDPMRQFTIEPLFGSDGWELAGYNIAFTNFWDGD